MRFGVVTAFIASCALVSATAFGQMTDGEKKAAARAAFIEGVNLQDANKPAEALVKFEAAQKLFDAPVHLLHIAECQEKLGKWVEASESYELLIRKNLGDNPPEVFKSAQEQAGKELPPLREKTPKLRITVKPDPNTLQNLYISVNDKPMPNELVGIQRPINPGTYKIAASANGYATREATTISIVERDVKAVELVLVQGATPLPIPPPYGNPNPNPNPNPKPDPDKKPPPPQEGPSSMGLLVGPRLGAFVPGGSLSAVRKVDTFAAAGVGGAIDVSLRLAKLLLVGVTGEYVSLSQPDKFDTQIPNGQKGDFSASSTYFGVTLGVIPDVDRVTFIGEGGLGRRSLGRTVTVAGVKSEDSYAGLELSIAAGLSIPAGPIRIAPKAGLSLGSFSSRDCKTAPVFNGDKFLGCDGTNSLETAGHTMFFVGVALYYHVDFGKKPATTSSARPSVFF